MIKLRDYQVDIVNSIRNQMISGNRKTVVQSPTGSGKTALAADMIATTASKGMTAWFVVHRRELVKQSAMAMSAIGLTHGIVATGFQPHYTYPVQIASIQTLVRRTHHLKAPNLIVWDEAHHCGAKTWTKLIDKYPNAYHIGLTATPQRLDGKGLDAYFNEIIEGPKVRWLIDNGFLSDYELYAPPTVDTSKLKTRMGDYARGESAKLMDKPSITGSAINEYLRVCPGKRAVVFCASVEHSQHTVDQFNGKGIRAEHVDGNTPADIRDAVIKRFSEGETQVLSNVELFGEGFDLPAMEAVILLRPTQSLGLYLQQVGRVLRPFPGKEKAFILDHANNCIQHGLPDDEREWSLYGRPKAGKGTAEKDSPVRVCPKCYAAQKPGTLECKYCGHEFPIRARVIEENEGNLEAVDLDDFRAKRKARYQEQGQQKSLDELYEYGKKMGYKNARGWAKHVFNARQAKLNRGYGG